MTEHRRFKPPWRVNRLPGGWEVTDANGVVLVRVYGDDRPKGVADRSLTMDEARRIAVGIARLSELTGRGKGQQASPRSDHSGADVLAVVPHVDRDAGRGDHQLRSRGRCHVHPPGRENRVGAHGIEMLDVRSRTTA